VSTELQKLLEYSGVAKLEIFANYNRTLNSTRFVTIYGYVQSNI